MKTELPDRLKMGVTLKFVHFLVVVAPRRLLLLFLQGCVSVWHSNGICMCARDSTAYHAQCYIVNVDVVVVVVAVVVICCRLALIFPFPTLPFKTKQFL